MRHAALLLSGSLLALGPAGCSGDSRLSQTEFRQRGNAICTEYFAQLNTLPQVTGAADLVAYIDKAQAYTTRALDRLEQLKPPEETQASLDDFVAQVRTEVMLEDDLRSAAKSKDSARLRSVAKRGDAMDRRANALAAQAGLDVCAEPSSNPP